MNRARAANPTVQRGLSLVELMISLALGLLVTLILIQVLLGVRDSNRYQSNQARLQENSRFALEKLAQVVRMNGYQGEAGADWMLGPLSATNGGLVPLAGSDDDTNGSDTIRATFRGTGDGFIKDCHGQVVPAGTTTLNRFSLSAANEFQCGVSTDAGVTWNTLTLVENVEAMHVLYGLDTTGDRAANQFVTAPNVPDMDDVVSVRIALLLVSQDDGLAFAVDNADYAVLDATVHAGAAAPGDRRLRRLATVTISLRNPS